MPLHYLAIFYVAIALIIGGPLALGQALAAPPPAPQAGIMIEPVQGNGGPESKFTNSTDRELAFIYGKIKFLLKPGKTQSIAIPQEQLIDLKIFERRLADEQIVPRFDGKLAPNAQKRFIPFPWAKPNNKEAAQQAAP